MLLVTPSNWMRCFSGAGSMSHPPVQPLLTRNAGASSCLVIIVPPHPSNRHLFLNTQGYPCYHTRVQLSCLTAAPFCLANRSSPEDNCGSSANPPRKPIWKWSLEPSKEPGSMPKTPHDAKGLSGSPRRVCE